MDKTKTACECRGISYQKIEDAVKNGAATFEEVSQKTGAGKSCGACREFIACMVERLLDEQSGTAQNE